MQIRCDFSRAIYHHLSHNVCTVLDRSVVTTCSRWCTRPSLQGCRIKFGIKPCMHLLKIAIFLLYHLIVRPIKIMNQADKNWAHFKKQSTLEVKIFKKKFIFKSWSLSLIFFTEKKFRKIPLIFDAENDFESTNFAIFDSLRRLFIILVGLTVKLLIKKMLLFTTCILRWFHIQLEQKIFGVIY